MSAETSRSAWRALVEVALVFVALPVSVWWLRTAAFRLTKGSAAAVTASMAFVAIAFALARCGRSDFTDLWRERRRTFRIAGWSVAASAAALLVVDPALDAPLVRLGVIWLLAAAEEVVFRVVVPSRFARLLSRTGIRPGAARFAAVVLAQIAFALCHVSPASPVFSRLFASGTLLALLVRRGLWMAIAAHCALNVELEFGTDLALASDWVGGTAFAGAALAWLACDVWGRPPSSAETSENVRRRGVLVESVSFLYSWDVQHDGS